MIPIVWGHNNYHLKTVQPHEIGIFDAASSNVKFELRQKYGHLFWIPFIPLGKIWVLNKGDGKKYHVTAQAEQRLNALGTGGTKAGIFAWTGPLLIIAGILLYTISEKVNLIKNNRQYAASFIENVNKLTSRIDSCKKNDFIVLNIKEENKNYFEYRVIPLKVLRATKDSVLLGAYAPASNSTINASHDSEIIDLAVKNEIDDSFWVAKSLLKKGVVANNKEESSFKGISIESFYLAGTFKVKDIINLAGPILEEDRMAEGRDAGYFELVNKGFNGVADSIITTTAGVNWLLSKQRSLNNGERIAIKTSGKGTAVLYCSDKDNNQYQYELNNTAYSVTVKKLH